MLWRTARAIFAQPAIDIPHGVRRLVEAVYAVDAHVPPGLTHRTEQAEGKDRAASAVAWQNLLNWADGYAQGAGAWASDVRTPTRLGNSGQIFRIGVWRDGRIEPCCPHGETSWTMSEISLPSWRVKGVPEETGARAAAVLALRKGWGRWEQEIPILLLDEQAIGTVIDPKGRPVTVRYSQDGGLVFATP